MELWRGEQPQVVLGGFLLLAGLILPLGYFLSGPVAGNSSAGRTLGDLLLAALCVLFSLFLLAGAWYCLFVRTGFSFDRRKRILIAWSTVMGRRSERVFPLEQFSSVAVRAIRFFQTHTMGPPCSGFETFLDGPRGRQRRLNRDPPRGGLVNQ